ncbi:hypothetical protein Pint_03901 [Pistacia integerrima]|uniref:Uncharacterized protein n=1 Tax=Pistacia integerrima TaxID=434235 RepID=A0ACC0Z8R3_9ROSI|nr:hypothetical protein Pint_03901 [Pistacia integerrima]
MIDTSILHLSSAYDLYSYDYTPRMALVLRGVKCTLLGGMKTGTIGRTGSGKSTLIQMLFRIVEPAAGTIGSNLDSLEEYTDEQIWEVGCFYFVWRVKFRLVTENGENWSMGQRRLVCLGRVLFKKSKILVLDEATASVDPATDNLIQQTLRQHFSESTVITIAHWITFVLDSDMVLLLNEGLIEEYDSPTKLLENKSSSLAQIVAGQIPVPMRS